MTEVRQGPTPRVRFREVSALERCPLQRGVRLNEVSVKRELTVYIFWLTKHTCDTKTSNHSVEFCDGTVYKVAYLPVPAHPWKGRNKVAETNSGGQLSEDSQQHLQCAKGKCTLLVRLMR